MTRTEELILRHEGYREKMYTDTTGHATIGIGFNLDAGMSEAEAKLLLKYRVGLLREHLSYKVPAFNGLSANRQDVLIDMAYNLGLPGLMKFKKMLAAVNEGGFGRASREMLNSKWADQVGTRAIRLAQMMDEG